MVKLTDLIILSITGIASAEVWLQIKKRLSKDKTGTTTSTLSKFTES